VALREIADETIQLETVQNALIKGMQKHVEMDEPEEERELEGVEAIWPGDIGGAVVGGDSVDEEAIVEEEVEEDMLAVSEEDADLGMTDIPGAEPGDEEA